MKRFRVWYLRNGNWIQEEYFGENTTGAHRNTIGIFVKDDMTEDSRNFDLEVHIKLPIGNYVAIPAHWLSDLDPDNIPEEVHCIVARMVTDELCQGDIIRFEWQFDEEWPVEKQLGVVTFNTEELQWMALTSYGGGEYLEIVYPKVLGHVLPHKINGKKVIKR